MIDETKPDKKVVIWTTPHDHRVGLLRYNSPPRGHIFIFKFTGEKVRIFHTVGLKFNIHLFFFDAVGKLVSKYIDVPPGVEEISSRKKCKYALEIPA